MIPVPYFAIRRTVPHQIDAARRLAFVTAARNAGNAGWASSPGRYWSITGLGPSDGLLRTTRTRFSSAKRRAANSGAMVRNGVAATTERLDSKEFDSMIGTIGGTPSVESIASRASRE